MGRSCDDMKQSYPTDSPVLHLFVPNPLCVHYLQVSNVVLTYNSINLNEGETGAYGISLSSPPIASVTVVLYSNCSQLSTTPSRLQFTPTNWSTPLPILAAAAKDGVNQVCGFCACACVWGRGVCVG